MRDHPPTADPDEQDRERVSPWSPLDDTFRDVATSVVAWLGVLAADVVLGLDEVGLYLLVYWDVMAVAYVLLTLLAMRSSVGQLRGWAAKRSGQASTWQKIFGGSSTLSQLPLMAAIMGLAASAFVLPRASDYGADRHALVTIACAVAVIGGWLVTHLSFLLQYAFLYYGSEPAGGLDFPETSEPGPLEFAYFAAAVGTTFGTTDVTVLRRDFRKAVLAHCLVSFLFNTAVLALTLTLLFS